MSNDTATTLQCPTCEGTTLVAVDRNGVTVDACPRCRGIWLDRGELDKLIELEAATTSDFLDEVSGRGHGGDKASDDRGDSGHGGGKKKRKREGFLGDFLDFG